MKHYQRITAFLLAMLLAISAVLCSCGDTSGDGDSTRASGTGNTADDDRLPSSLPSDLRFDGETISVWSANESYSDLVGDVEGDDVGAAMYERNIAVEEQLGVTLNYHDSEVSTGDMATSIRQMQLANDTDYDLYYIVQWGTSQLVMENCYMDVSGALYLDLEQPWWSQAYMEAASAGDAIYYLAGDISLDMIRCSGAVYYNKDIYAEIYRDGEALYQTVLDGEWTMEYMAAATEEAFVDNNNNSKADDGDRIGLLTNTFNNIDCFTFGAGAYLTDRDEYGIPYFTVTESHNVDVYDKTFNLVYNTPGATIETDTLSPVAYFQAGNLLFLPGFLNTSHSLRDVNNYGIVPFPKYDEDQSDYISSVHDIATLMCLPANCAKVEAVCAVLEASAYYNYYEVTPVYYEMAMKSRYVRDSLSTQMVDIIRRTSMTDFAYVYADALKGIGMIMRNLIATNKPHYFAEATQQLGAAKTELNKIIAKFE